MMGPRKRPPGPLYRGLWVHDGGLCRARMRVVPSLPHGLPSAGRAGPDDAQDGEDEQDGKGHVRADEGGGEDCSQDGKGWHGGMGQRGEEGGEGAGEGAEDEGGQAKCPDAGTGLSVGHVSPPASDRLHGRYRAYHPSPISALIGLPLQCDLLGHPHLSVHVVV